jgi:hypothetical protein
MITAKGTDEVRGSDVEVWNQLIRAFVNTADDLLSGYRFQHLWLPQSLVSVDGLCRVSVLQFLQNPLRFVI